MCSHKIIRVFKMPIISSPDGAADKAEGCKSKGYWCESQASQTTIIVVMICFRMLETVNVRFWRGPPPDTNKLNI